MRISTYEIILPLTGKDERSIKTHALLINGLYGAFDVVKKDESEKISNEDFTNLPPKLLERLELRGHITKKDESEEFADMKILSRIYKKIYAKLVVSPVIMPTYDCNFRCPYCYEQHRLKNGQEWLERKMSAATMDAIFSALKDYKNRGYILGGCTLYGGEPLLKENVEVVGKIAEHCLELGMKMDAVTNGYDLDAYLDLLEKFKIERLQVTVDGTAKINDRRRIHKNGGGSYERILKNVESALARGIKISLRVNVGRENLHDMRNLIDDLTARGFIDNENFYYYFKAANDDINPKNNVSEKDIIDELMKTGFTAAEAIEHQSQYNLPAKRISQLFKKESFSDFSTSYCGSEGQMLVIDPSGRIFTCWDLVGIKANEVGFVDIEKGKILWQLLKAKWNTRTSDSIEKCKTCPYVFFCKGGCAARADYEHKSFFREHCGESQSTFNFVASRLAGAFWNKNHQEELSISLAEVLNRLTDAERETLMTTQSRNEILNIIKGIGLSIGKIADNAILKGGLPM